MIDLPANALETLNRLFAKYVPHCEVRAFGSRVKWTSKDYSDLDLAIVCDEPIERKLFNRLKEEIEEIPINFRVDLLDWHKISPEFQEVIEKQYEVIYIKTSSKSDEWKYYRVDEFAEIVGGGTPKTDINIYWNGSIPWLTPKDLSGYTNRFISNGERYISAEGLKNSSAKLIPSGTVLLTSRAPVGYVAIAQNELCTNQGFRSLILKEGFDSEFIYYLLFYNTEYLKSHATGTTFQELSGGSLKNLSFQIPSLKTQKKIAHILSTLDDKIELNRKMNQTLEEMASAIFKSWFVDFDPVHAKANCEGEAELENIAKELGISKAILDLFPSEFEESELGMIPKGWEVVKFSEHIEVIKGKSYKSDELHESKTALVTLKSFLRGGGYRTDGLKPYIGSYKKEQVVKSGEMIIAYTDVTQSADVIGKPAIVLDDENIDIFVASLDVGIVRIKTDDINLMFLYQLFRTPSFQGYILGHTSGTTVLHLSKSWLENFVSFIPNNILMRKFQDITQPLFDKFNENTKQIRSLEKTRDTLLPKLLSGEIDVSELEK